MEKNGWMYREINSVYIITNKLSQKRVQVSALWLLTIYHPIVASPPDSEGKTYFWLVRLGWYLSKKHLL